MGNKKEFLITFKTGFFGDPHGWGRVQNPPPPPPQPLKICHTYPTILKLYTNFVWVFKGFSNKHGYNFDNLSKIG